MFIISIGIIMNLINFREIHKIFYTLDKEFLEDNNVTLNEAFILYSLYNKKTSCASYLSNQIGLSNSRTSKILESLEVKKYIIRRIGKLDKRKMIFSLTDKGREKIKEIQARENKYTELIIRLAKMIKEIVTQ